VVDLQESREFQNLGVELLSIAPDTADAWRKDGQQWGIRNYDTVLSDEGNEVAGRYGVLRWRHPVTGEPGHTFILVDESGAIAWVKDYGAPEHRSIMYVIPEEIVRQVQRRL
jgi:peroxiredoxin